MESKSQPLKKASAKASLPHLPTGVPMLRLFDQKTFGDVHAAYEAMVDQNYPANKAYEIKAKLKTALRRYALPGFGWVFAKEETAWLNFMGTLSLQDLSRALDIQKQVFTQLQETVSEESCRVYRAALKKLVEYAQEQPYYQTALGTQDEQLAPRMHTHQKRQEHWHRLKPSEVPSQATHELDQVMHYLAHDRDQTAYGGTLSAGSRQRYRRELLDMLGWLHRLRGLPLDTLSLECLVPRAAITDAVLAADTAALLLEYVEWLQQGLGLGKGGLPFAVRSCIYVAEFWEYEQHRGLAHA